MNIIIKKKQTGGKLAKTKSYQRDMTKIKLQPRVYMIPQYTWKITHNHIVQVCDRMCVSTHAIVYMHYVITPL